MGDPEARESREVYYSGRVQGVGFRYSVRELAAHFAVTGLVRNMPDGRVHLIAEGPASEIRGLLNAVHDRFGRLIVNVQESVGPAPGRFETFDIRF